jgi:hypothetical protein
MKNILDQRVELTFVKPLMGSWKIGTGKRKLGKNGHKIEQILKRFWSKWEQLAKR